MKYKVGDRVQINSNHTINPKEIGIVRSYNENSELYRVEFENGFNYYEELDIEPEVKTLDTLIAGDVVQNSAGDTLTIQGKIGEVYITTYPHDNATLHSRAFYRTFMSTAKELERWDYKIVTEEPKEPKEFTQAEIEKLVGGKFKIVGDE